MAVTEERECIFCERAEGEKITKEHVYGRWTGALLPPDADRRRTWSVARESPQGPMTQRFIDVPAPRHETTIRSVCLSCNTGWMATMEGRVRPIAGPMIERKALTVTKEEAAILAAWATKIAIVREFVDRPTTRVATVAQRHHLRIHGDPAPGIWVWAAFLPPGSHWELLDRRVAVGMSPVGEPLAPAANVSLATVGIGGLLLIVLVTSADLTVHDPVEIGVKLVVRLWPDPYEFQWPPGAVFTDDEIAQWSGDAGLFVSG